MNSRGNMRISTVAQMRNLDRGALEEYGIPPLLLMENAGLAVYDSILEEMGVEGLTFAILCGPGNNGGDGFVVARKILSSGGDPLVYLLSNPDGYKGVARQNYEILSKMPVEISIVDSLEVVEQGLEQSDAIIDGILGTGIQGEVKGLYREIIEAINESGLPVFSIDIPSGVHGDTGEIMGAAVRADVTTAFGLPKVGNLMYPGFEQCGKLYVSHISFPPEHYTSNDIMLETSKPPFLPDRIRDGHKGTFGQALFVSGAAGYMGAPYFAAMSFLKAGGGYSRLATPKSIAPFLATRGSEIVLHPMPETSSGSLSPECEDDILDIASGIDFTVLGPGLSLDEGAGDLVRRLVTRLEGPLLIDGDGISAVCKDLDCVRDREWPTVLTPHPGEMARMTDLSVKEILSNRVEVIREASADLNATIVLKTAHSLIARPDGHVSVNLSGNPGMGSAGSGDVLTGTIAAMNGLGQDFEDAVITGVFIHGLSGDLAANEKGEDGITAQDVLDYLPMAMILFREEYEELMEDCYGKVFMI
jgi:hydroxyethylthiazole kinase-like uncharacterized protein yjeF